ncbi:MAG: type I glyceraldehyde-3-phosphate dehydrogenase [Gammaproteobacteria bacterium]|jgi:glyceraldehyde 3-phosphate dehydrogenase|nr:type I glyceraldehyde-3-phosphate dehydrogenase [Gammaproteobacteria bacterium]
MKIAINGFGRIGRALLRAVIDRPDSGLKVTHINDLASIDAMAHLFEFDSVHGRFRGDVVVDGEYLLINGQAIKVSAKRNLSDLTWPDVDYVCECTGLFTTKAELQAHIQAGAKRVLLSAPSLDTDVMVVYGVNHQDIQNHKVISNASCTTNCLAPVVHVLHKAFDFMDGSMVTVHSYTSDQRLVDAVHPDLRRARAAGLSMIPTKTGAAKAIGAVIPELDGRLDGYALRVPTANVSLVDLTCRLAKSPTVLEVAKVLKAACENEMKGIMAYSEKPLVSIDYNHQPYSATVDGLEIKKVGALYKILAWYDNEWGFVNRMIDVMVYAKV